MSCKYKNECPSYTGWCEASEIDFEKCIPFIITAYKNEKHRLDTKPLCKMGDCVWTIERDDDDEPYSIVGYTFLAMCDSYVIATNGYVHSRVMSKILSLNIDKDSIMPPHDEDTVIFIPYNICYFDKMQAEVALKEMENGKKGQ